MPPGQPEHQVSLGEIDLVVRAAQERRDQRTLGVAPGPVTEPGVRQCHVRGGLPGDRISDLSIEEPCPDRHMVNFRFIGAGPSVQPAQQVSRRVPG